MASLTGQRIKDTYQSLLKTSDNGLVTSTFKGITDGSGSASGLYLRNTGVMISGSLVISGSLIFSGSVSASYAATASNIQGGTANYVPLWTGASSLGTSSLFESASVLKTVSASVDKGLKLDFANNVYTLGNNLYQNGTIAIDNGYNEIYIHNQNIQIGNPDTTTLFQIYDNNSTISEINTLHQFNAVGLKLDFVNNLYKFGDFDNTSGSTKLIIDDNARRITVSGSTIMSGSLTVTNGITGSLFGTASWAQNAISSSYPIAITGSTIYSIGTGAGGPTFDANSTYRNVFLGWQAGVSSSAYESIIIGNNAGFRASPGYATFIGLEAGYSASNANESNFIGLSAGSRATNASNSNFLGKNAGFQASEAPFSTFLGGSAGAFATNAYDSTFVGFSAGASAINAYKSQFVGEAAGEEARNAYNSSIIGYFAGYYARNANNAVFIGESAGAYAASASYSILIGKQAGASPGGDQTKTIGSNNIIIGHNLTLPTGRKNSINLGAIIFATGSYFSSGNPDFDYTLFSGSANGRVGINQPTPTQALDVSGSVQISQVLVLPSQNPLPVGQPTGSFAVSGSGVDCKPYFWNGSTWTALF